jgi:hypothetical protein
MNKLVLVDYLFAIVRFADGTTHGYELQGQSDGKFVGKGTIFVPDRTSVESVSIVDEKEELLGHYSLEPCVFPSSKKGYQFNGAYPNWRIWIRITFFDNGEPESNGRKAGVTVLLTPRHVNGSISKNGEVA